MRLDAPAGEKMAVFVSHAFVLYLNPLPVPHIDGPFLFGPNRFFRDYLEGRNIGLRVKMCVWLGVSRGLDLAFLNAD